MWPRRSRRTTLRDYSRKRFHNPLFERREYSRPRNIRRLAVMGLIMAALAGWIWFLAFSGFFSVTRVDIKGNARVATWEIEDAVKDIMKGRRWWLAPNDNLMFLSEDDLSAQLIDRFVLASAEVTKKPPRTISITVAERVSSIMMSSPDGSHTVLDLDGTAIRVFRPGESTDVAALGTQGHLIVNEKDEKIALRERVLSKEVVETVVAARNAMQEVWNDTPAFAEARIEGKGSQTVKIVTSEGWTIYVDAKQPLKEQLANAKAIIESKVGQDRPKLEYIDVRFGEKIFYRMR
jgi:hypothetical protein